MRELLGSVPRSGVARMARAERTSRAGPMSKDRSDSADRAYAQFLVLRARDPGTDFEAFCGRHPEQASELRRLHALRAGEGSNGPHEPSGETELHETPPRGEDDSHAAVVERLLTHSPRHSRYTLRKEIARGGMGKVLQVWDPDLHRHLARKVMLARRGPHESDPSAPDPTALYRFLEEAQVTGQLEHPAIVPVHELGIDADGQVYFTMPLVRGSDFRRVIRSVHGQTSADALGEWDLTRAVGILLKVCHAVAFAHSKGVIHRDLKPTNVMVGRFGEVYVMDWGLARVLDREDPHDLRLRPRDLELASQVLTERSMARDETPESPLETMDGTVVGTPAYMSPEQAQGRISKLGPRSDVYALGAMLYQLLSGQMPFAKAGTPMSPHMILGCLLSGPPASVRTLAPDAPGDLAAICEKAMQLEPEDRYASALELARDLEAWLGHRPVAAQPSSAGYLFKLFVQRNRVASAVTAVAATFIVAVVAVFIGRLSEEVRSTQAALDQVREERGAKDFVAGIHASRSLADETGDLALLPAALGSLDTWLARVDQLLPQAEVYRSKLATLPEGAAEGRELAQTLEGMQALRAMRPRIEGFRGIAATLRQRSLDDQADAWRRAIESIASSEEYGGLELVPQEGLVPLELDDWTGLWSFWHVASGERPRPGSKPGSYELRPEDGIVLVLVPGGSFTMGALDGGDGEPPHDESVAAFFLSKYELTQAQYERITGSNLAWYRPGPMPKFGDTREIEEPDITVLHPMESVNWLEAARFCQRLGLRLQSEAEWEFACRAGTESAYAWGDDSQCLKDRENVNDQTSISHTLPPHAAWDDGFPLHSPVGSYEPNPFGLHDMHGNLSEWCSDAVDESAVRTVEGALRAIRGGNWALSLDLDRVAFRQWGPPRTLNQALGIRPARSVDLGR